MNKWTQEDLILYYYGELPEDQAKAVEQVLQNDPALKQSYADLTAVFALSDELDIPEPDSGFEQRMMAGLKPHIHQSKAKKKRFWLFAGRPFSQLATAMALVLVVGVFFLGRWSAVDDTPSGISLAEEDSQRILLQRLAQHLGSTDRMLTSLANGEADDLTQQRQETIQQLVTFNRLYRQVAESDDDRQLVELLSQMERVLLQLAHADASSEAEDFEQIRSRLADSDLLYKLRVTNKKLTQTRT